MQKASSVSYRDDDHLYFCVEDQGPGISRELQQRLFNEFETGAYLPSTAEKSTGLGLAIAHKIVTEHRGQILIESAPGQGASLTVKLPIDQPQ